MPVSRQYGGGVNDSRPHPGQDRDDAFDDRDVEDRDVDNRDVDNRDVEDEETDRSFDEILDEDGEDAGDRPGWARGRWSTGALAAAGVVGALVGAAILAVVTWSWSDAGDEGDVQSEVVLTNLASYVGNARAFVVEIDDQLALRIEAASLPDAADAYNQVWLVDDTDQMNQILPIGVLDSDRDQWIIPNTVDLATLNHVVVTQERYDGDAGPTGSRLWTGLLPALD